MAFSGEYRIGPRGMDIRVKIYLELKKLNHSIEILVENLCHKKMQIRTDDSNWLRYANYWR